MKNKFAAMLAGSSLLALVGPAFAQPITPETQPRREAPPAAEEESEDGEIVVTGTFIRGIAPTGNQTLGVTAEDVQASGASNATELLTTIPQLTQFNEVNVPGVFGNSGGASNVNGNSRLQVNRPVLRNTSNGLNVAGSTPTLILMDGHRMVGAGVNQASPDAGVIPAGALARVEIITDGGSALYGTDAVGGVINFITRDRFDGVRVDGRYGFNDHYATYDASITAGTDWGSGSVFGSYARSESDPVFGADLDWWRAIEWNPASPNYLRPAGRNCDISNVSIGLSNYPYDPATGNLRASNTPPNSCDVLDDQTLSPEQTTENFFGGFTQELTNSIEFNVRGFFTHRETMNYQGAITGTVSVDDEILTLLPGATVTPGTSPWYENIPGAAANGAVQNVLFNYSSYNGDRAYTRFTDLQTWGVTPALTVDLPAEWQLNALVNYGESETYYRNREPNGVRQQAYAVAPTQAAALNPYNVAATNPAIIADILNWQRYGFAHQTMTNYRAVFDGPLLTLPGGAVRAAFGAEYIKEEIESRQGQSNYGGESVLPTYGTERDVTAFFGELNIPIIGPHNRLPLVEALTLAVSARRDEYSDFGETTNPQVGLVYEPTDWLAFRATWAQSFNAPSPAEVLGQRFPTVEATALRSITSYAQPGIPASVPGQFIVALNGSAPDLVPQDAESWSLGFDAHAPFLPNLRASLTWYKLDFHNLLAQPTGASFGSAQSYATYSHLICLPPAAAGSTSVPLGPDADSNICNDVDDFIRQGANFADLAGLTAGQVYVMVDVRNRNLGDQVQEGVDFSLRYSHDLDWGTFDASVSGNYRINAENRSLPTAPMVTTNLDFNNSRFNYTANVGMAVGDFYGRASLRHSHGYHVTPSATTGPFGQWKIEPYDVVDLFFRYDLGEVGVVDDLSLTLNIDNAFDTDPPINRANGSTGAANGTTLGRVFAIGVSADF